MIDGVDVAAAARPLQAPHCGLEGIEELEPRVGEGRRIVADMPGVQLLRVPDDATIGVEATVADSLGEWQLGSRGLAYLRHDLSWETS